MTDDEVLDDLKAQKAARPKPAKDYDGAPWAWQANRRKHPARLPWTTLLLYVFAFIGAAATFNFLLSLAHPH
jgi:hypothetical protein